MTNSIHDPDVYQQTWKETRLCLHGVCQAGAMNSQLRAIQFSGIAAVGALTALSGVFRMLYVTARQTVTRAGYTELSNL